MIKVYITAKVLKMRYSYRWLAPENSTLDKPHYRVPIDREFEDLKTVKSPERPQREELIETLVAGDEVLVWCMFEFGKSMKDLHTSIDRVLGKGASIHFLSEQLSFCRKTNGRCLPELMQLLDSIVKFNNSVVLGHRREGIEKRKAAGNFKGRKSKFTPKKMDKIRKEFRESRMTKAELAKKWGISRAYLYKIVRSD